MHNVIQAEFFLLNVRTPSLNALLSEAAERRTEGSPLKCVIRFYEDDGAITSAISEHAILRARLDEPVPEGLFRRWMANRRREKAVSQMVLLRRQMHFLMVKQLHAVVNTAGPLAVEKSDHRFRHVHPDEVHELIESIKQAKGMWLFVFSHNHLLSDRMNLIGCSF